MEAKDAALEWLNSLRRGVAESTTWNRLQAMVTRLVDASRASGRRGMNRVWNTVGEEAA